MPGRRDLHTKLTVTCAPTSSRAMVVQHAGQPLMHSQCYLSCVLSAQHGFRQRVAACTKRSTPSPMKSEQQEYHATGSRDYVSGMIRPLCLSQMHILPAQPSTETVANHNSMRSPHYSKSLNQNHDLPPTSCRRLAPGVHATGTDMQATRVRLRQPSHVHILGQPRRQILPRGW